MAGALRDQGDVLRYLVEFSVPFVQGKGRPRFTKSGRAYTPKATADAERAIAIAYQGASIRRYGKVVSAPEGVPVAFRVDAYKAPPKSWPKGVPKWLKPNLPFVQKPDGDNLSKLKDSLNGIAWHDDAQVVNEQVIKHERTKGTETRMEFKVMWEVPEISAEDDFDARR